jgi:hypothetical protein
MSLSSNDNAEVEDEMHKMLLKTMFMCGLLSEACTSGVESCQQIDENSALHVYVKGFEKANALIRTNIYEYSLFHPEVTSIIEDEAKIEVQPMIESLAARVAEVLERGGDHPAEQSGVPSSSANISVASTSVSGVANGQLVDSSNDVDEGHSKKRDNPPPQRSSNNISTVPTIPPSVGRTRTRQREMVVYDEEDVKEQVRNVIEKVQEVFNSTNHSSEPSRGIAMDSPLLQMAACTIMEKISSGTNLLENISAVLSNLLCASEGTYTARNGLVSNLRGEADIFEGFQTFTSSESMGTLLASLDQHKSTNELEYINSVSQMVGVSNAIPVRHIDSTDGYLPTEHLKEYSVNDQAYKNFLLILGNVWMGAKVISLWTMGEIFYLLIDEYALKETANELHRLKCNCELDESMGLLDFIETVLLPLSNDEEHRVEAVKLLLVIKDVLTNTGTARVKKELQPTRKDKILDKSSRAQSEDLNENVVSGGKDHLGSSGTTHDTRRRDLMNAFFNLVMAEHIERKLPPKLLASRGGLGLGLLRLSSSIMTRTCHKFTPEFMFGSRDEDKQTAAALHRVYDADDKALKALKTSILKEKRNKNDSSFEGKHMLPIA